MNDNEKLKNAVCNNDYNSAYDAIREGANVNYADTYSILYYALYHKSDKEIVKLLLENGANIVDRIGSDLFAIFTENQLTSVENLKVLLFSNQPTSISKGGIDLLAMYGVLEILEIVINPDNVHLVDNNTLEYAEMTGQSQDVLDFLALAPSLHFLEG